MEQGTCGKNLVWTFQNDTLTISGNGEMNRYAPYRERPAPWYEYKYSIIKVGIKHGVTTIGKAAFRDCSHLESITIPNSVTEIGNGAFCNCKSLTEIKIPDGVTEIGSGAFRDCDSLTEIKIPDGVTEIGSEAFYYCDRLKKITIPDSVTEIGSYAFQSCKSLKEIKIPDGVTEIGSQAFQSCKSLKEITIPYELKKLGEYVLDDCTSLEKIYYRADSGFESKLGEDNNAQLIPLDKLNWKIEGNTLTLDGIKLKDYSKETPPWHDYLKTIQRIVIENGVRIISAHAFEDCPRLEHIAIPASVTTIGELAFTFSYCGNRAVNGGKNVFWSLDDGTLIIKKNPAATVDADFSTDYESWRVAEKNIKSIKVEHGVILGKRFFDWFAQQPYSNQLFFF